LKKLTINVFTNELVWMGQIDSAKSLVHRSAWFEIPTSELVVSKTAQGIEELQIGRILVVNNQRDKALIIEDLSANVNDEYITFNCVSLKGMLNYRICHPTDSGTYALKYQSEVMMEIVRKNLISQTRDNDRKFWNNAGTVNLLKVASTKYFGETIDFTVDWDTGEMGDAITSIAKMYGVDTTVPVGWNIYITEDYKSYEMDVWHGTHKHVDQTDLPPVVFSEDFGNITNATYEYSIKDWRNVAYMTWTDETDVERVSTVLNMVKGYTKTFNRKEMIFSSSKKLAGEVSNEGKSELNKRPHIESFTAEIIDNENTMSTYRKDWDLGYIVTIQSRKILKDKLITINSQITEIEEIYDSGEYSINATFGEGKLSFVKLIKQYVDPKTRM
jgi:hypothetical protein